MDVSLVLPVVLGERFLSPRKGRADMDRVLIPCAVRKPELFPCCSTGAAEGGTRSGGRVRRALSQCLCHMVTKSDAFKHTRYRFHYGYGWG